MTKHQYILLSTSVIGVVVLFFCTKAYYEDKRDELYVKARTAFAKALEQELSKRDVAGELAFSFDVQGRLNIDEIPDTIYWADETGKKVYILDPEKHRKNITEDPNVRALHTYALQKKPIVSDTLNIFWQNYLKENGILCKSGLRIEVTDDNEKVTTFFTPDNKWFKNLIINCTIGYRCEIEVMGYLDYGMWDIIGVKGLGLFLLYCLFIVELYRVIIRIEKRINRPPVVEIKEVSTIEFVKDSDKGPVRSYRLSDHSIFYAKHKKIVTDDKEEKISPQNSALLECFLNAEEYKLTDDEIKECLWPNGSGTSVRLHQAIKRLREVLHMEPNITIERVETNAYQLYM